jgi:hypothetical protein
VVGRDSSRHLTTGGLRGGVEVIEVERWVVDLSGGLVWDGRGGRVGNEPVANVLPSALGQSQVNGFGRNL